MVEHNTFDYIKAQNAAKIGTQRQMENREEKGNEYHLSRWMHSQLFVVCNRNSYDRLSTASAI